MRKILIALAAAALLAGCATGYGYSDYDGHGYGDYYYGSPSYRVYDDYYGVPYGYGRAGLGYYGGRGYYGSLYGGWGWPWYGGYSSWYGVPGYYGPGYSYRPPYRPPHRPPTDNQPPPDRPPHERTRLRTREEIEQIRGRPLNQRVPVGPAGNNRLRDPSQLRRPPSPQGRALPAGSAAQPAPPSTRLRDDGLRVRQPEAGDSRHRRPVPPVTRVTRPEAATRVAPSRTVPASRVAPPRTVPVSRVAPPRPAPAARVAPSRTLPAARTPQSRPAAVQRPAPAPAASRVSRPAPRATSRQQEE